MFYVKLCYVISSVRVANELSPIVTFMFMKTSFQMPSNSEPIEFAARLRKIHTDAIQRKATTTRKLQLHFMLASKKTS